MDNGIPAGADSKKVGPAFMKTGTLAWVLAIALLLWGLLVQKVRPPAILPNGEWIIKAFGYAMTVYVLSGVIAALVYMVSRNRKMSVTAWLILAVAVAVFVTPSLIFAG